MQTSKQDGVRVGLDVIQMTSCNSHNSEIYHLKDTSRSTVKTSTIERLISLDEKREFSFIIYMTKLTVSQDEKEPSSFQS